ncbi:MAG: SGNH/GDSL hydrolase family protein [Gemmatimonadetes bacterium]|nr:SGNH/GDSL hydrolase family protein [Gemmatimonadota bacterium]
MRHFLVRAGRGVTVTWQILGMTLLTFALVECGYRAVAAAQARSRGVTQRSYTPGDPQERLPWHAPYVAEFDAVRAQQWQPYVYWRRKPDFRGRYVNVDSAARRVTPQPRVPATPAARVFLFGGSTMWGTGQRDSATIAAEVARRLQPLAGVGARIEVTNFGENGWVSTQGMIALQLALRAGARPDVVLFYDGINDVAATVQWGQAGVSQNEFKREREFAFGRAMDHEVSTRSALDDLRALPLLAGEVLHQSAFIGWVKSLAPRRQPAFIAADSAADRTVAVYAETARMVEALGARYGFTPVFVWQPTPQSTGKVLTKFESRLLVDGDKDAYWRRLHEVHALVPARWRDAMAGVAPGRAVDASTVFRGDSMAVFTDRTGHTTESAVPAIVDAFWPVLARVTRERLRAPRS